MRSIFLIVFSFLLMKSSGQGFRSRYYPQQSSENLARDIFEISPGNYIGAGFARDTSTGYARTMIVLTGLDAQGQVTWVKKHHGGSIEYQGNMFIARTFYKQGNFIYYAGCAYDSAGGNGRQFGVFLKYNLNGDTLWRKIYRDSDSLEDIIPQMVTGSVDGGFLLTGFFQHWGNHTRPCLVMKTDANGNELWRKKINKTNTNVSDGKAIIQDSASKKIVVVGYQYIGGSIPYPHILILDSLGAKKYQGKFYNDPGGDALDLIQTPDKKFVMVGRKSYTHVIEMPEVVKAVAIKFDMDSPAIPIWTLDSVKNLSHENTYNSARVLPNGDIMLGGYKDSLIGTAAPNYTQSNLTSQFVIIGNNGIVKKRRYYSYYPPASGIQFYQYANSFNLCSDGGWVAAIGCTKYPGPNPLFFVKYDSTGCDSSLAYCAFVNSVGIEEFKVQSRWLSGSRFTVYPNPVSDELYVQNSYGQTENTELSIIGVNGREIKKKMLKPESKVNVSNLNPGIYFLQIRQNKELVYKAKIIKE